MIGGMSGQKNESDAKISYRNAAYNNTYPNLGDKDYGSSYQLRNNQNLPQIDPKNDPRNYNNLGGIIARKNDSLGALESKIRSTEKELNMVREKLENNNAIRIRPGAQSYYGNINRINNYTPSYKTSQPWATHDGINSIHAKPFESGLANKRQIPAYANTNAMYNYNIINR